MSFMTQVKCLFICLLKKSDQKKKEEKKEKGRLWSEPMWDLYYI